MPDGSNQNAVVHTCGRPLADEESSLATVVDGLAAAVEDAVEDMKAEVVALALANLNLVLTKIWELVREQFTSAIMVHG